MEQSYFAHPSAIVDEHCTIGDGTKIWHFSHIMEGAVIGRHCNIGQNVVISPGVVLGIIARCRIMYLSIQEWFAGMMFSLALHVFLQM